MSKRGGMCRRPFGQRIVEGSPVSNRRLDKIEAITEVLRGDTSPEYAIFADMLLKCIHNYFYWGLGRNGCTDVKWQDAYEYLFQTHSERPETWGSREFSYTEDLPDKTRVRHVVQLTDDEMRIRCFDVHYGMLNLDRVLPLSSFLRWLAQERASIVTENRKQIESYLESLRENEFKRMAGGSQLTLRVTKPDFIQTMTRPETVRQVEELVMFPLPRVRECRTSVRRKPCTGWRRPRESSFSTTNGGTVREEANVGHTHHTAGSTVRGLSPLQAA